MNIELKSKSSFIPISENESRSISKPEPDKLFVGKNTNTSKNRQNRMRERREFLKKMHNKNKNLAKAAKTGQILK